MNSTSGGREPDQAFWLLSDPMRMDILRTVAKSDGSISFSEIRTAVGNPDGGRFNYHVDNLRGHFLERGDDGYRLTQSGREVVRAVLAGSITDVSAMKAGEIDGECVECGALLLASYDDYGQVECGDCGTAVMWNEFPPAGLTDRDVTAFSRAFDRWTQHRFRLAEGICPSCATRMTTDGIDVSSGDAPATTTHRCSNCGYEARIPLFGHAIQHPAVISFYYEAGIDVTTMPYWDLLQLLDSRTENEISSDPQCVRLAFSEGGRELSLTIDESLGVTDIVVSDS